MKKVGVIIAIAISLAAMYKAAMEVPRSGIIDVNVRVLPGIGAR
jgi:hypothetical protein